MDFRDLNKACPKDDFPLPYIDVLVDNTVGSALMSFMDGFSGYNQIKMAPKDMTKTTFTTKWTILCYIVMAFGLKNAGAIYQRMAIAFLYDMMNDEVEVYVDDMIVKSKDQGVLRLNPEKCIFEVTAGKLLRFVVSDRGIKVDLSKIKAILDMPPPKSEKEIRGFLGQLQYYSIHHQTHIHL